MRVRIRVFAVLKDYFQSEFELDLPEGALTRDVLEKLVELNPRGEEALECCRLAVGEDLVDAGHPLTEGDQVSLLPPSSGG